jgi:hypothetical protein
VNHLRSVVIDGGADPGRGYGGELEKGNGQRAGEHEHEDRSGRLTEGHEPGHLRELESENSSVSERDPGVVAAVLDCRRLRRPW